MFQNKIGFCLRNSLRGINQLRMYSNQKEPVRIEKSINNVTLLGRVGADPQRRGTNEHPVVVFSVATHSNYKYETGDFMQKTEWHRIAVFKPNLRESILNFLKKGQRVHVAGRLTYGEVKGEDGNTKVAASIVADDVIFLQSNSS